MTIDQQLSEQLNALAGSKAVILGMGNVLRGDDAVGPFLCEQLADKVCTEVIDAGTVPENYIQRIVSKKPQTLLVIDAIDFGASPGEIKVFKTGQLNSIAISTHTLSPRLFVELIAGQIDVAVAFVGIQPAHVKLGEPIVRAATRSEAAVSPAKCATSMGISSRRSLSGGTAIGTTSRR